MVRQDIQRLHAFGFSVFLNLVPEEVLGSRLVRNLAEPELSPLLQLLDTPAGQQLGQFRYVLLGVTAVHAESVQFHDFARVVFIQSGWALLRLRTRPRKTPLPTHVRTRAIN